MIKIIHSLSSPKVTQVKLENIVHKILVLSVAAILSISSAQAITSNSGPTASFNTQDFISLSSDIQRTYVAGVIDGFIYVNYSHQFAAYDAIVKCVNSKNINGLTVNVLDWLNAHPDFNEGLSSAVIQTISTYCA